MPPEKQKGFDLVGVAAILGVIGTFVGGLLLWSNKVAAIDEKLEAHKQTMAAHEAEDQRQIQRVFVTLDRIDNKVDKLLTKK